MDSSTPTAMINSLLRVITTDATIANYVNGHFGTKIPASRIAELRRLKGTPHVTNHGDPIPNTDQSRAEKSAKLGSDRLLKAIRKAYPKGVPA